MKSRNSISHFCDLLFYFQHELQFSTSYILLFVKNYIIIFRLRFRSPQVSPIKTETIYELYVTPSSLRMLKIFTNCYTSKNGFMPLTWSFPRISASTLSFRKTYIILKILVSKPSITIIHLHATAKWILDPFGTLMRG